jgi:hypothetical protein
LFVTFLINFSNHILISQNNPPPLDTNLICEPPTYKITKFNLRNKGSATKKPWKVVIGRETEYEISTLDKSDSWIWKEGDNDCSSFIDFWKLESTNISKKYTAKSNQSKNLEAIIPNSILKDRKITNLDFGYSHKDVNASLNSDCYEADSIVNVFFEKDAYTNPDGNDSIPNWFYYWSQIDTIQKLLTIPGIHLFETATCTFTKHTIPLKLKLQFGGGPKGDVPGATVTFGYSNFNMPIASNVDACPINIKTALTSNYAVSYVPDLKIVLNNACGYFQPASVCNPDSATRYGIHGFYSTFIHEREHAIITCEVWNFITPLQPYVYPTYSSEWDEDGDGYKDIWETAHKSDYFTLNEPKDRYSGDYTKGCLCENLDKKPPNTPDCTVGSRYEELRVRSKSLHANMKVMDKYDWSFDFTNKIQGKQWEK